MTATCPFTKIPAKDVRPGMRLWDHDGDHVTVTRTAGDRSSRFLGIDASNFTIWFIGAISGREVPLRVNAGANIKIVADPTTGE